MAPDAAGAAPTRRRRRTAKRLLRTTGTLLAPLAALLLRALARTWRVRIEGPDPFAVQPPSRRLAAVWHRNVLVAAGVFRDTGVCVPVSRSADGDAVVALMRHLGLGPPPRGSSRRGGVSLLRELVRVVRGGGLVAVMPDGPVGPPRVAKPGVIEVARLTGEPIVPVALSARPCLRFRSWDRMLLPPPFARVVCRYGEPLSVGARARGPEREALCAALDAQLDALTDALDRELGLGPSRP
jgi:lysophospholipid acyltransferase (LPLAT)-like uncharacterized protein